jgi:hypothetical protein
MKKPSMGPGGMNAFLANHVEKMIFGACLLIMLVFVYLGFSLEPYTKLPEDIKSAAEQARQNVERDSWENVASDPDRLVAVNYTAAVQEGNVPTRGALYSYEMPLKVPLVRPLVKRGDPELYPPVKVVVRSMNAPIALRRQERQVDKLAELESQPMPEQTRPRQEQRERRRGRGDGMEGYGAMMDPGSMMPPGSGETDYGDYGAMMGGGGTGAGRLRILKNPEGWRPGGAGMGGMGGMGYGAAGGMGGMGYGEMGMEDDTMSGMPGGMPGGMGGGTRSATSRFIPSPRQIISVMALIPYEKQVDEYRRRFENSVGYNPMRDRPNYLSFTVERAEVTGDPEAPLNWVRAGSANTALTEARKWAAHGTDVSNPLYTLPRTTMPVPPILLRDFDSLVSHPDIPKRTRQRQARPAPRRETPDEDPTDSDVPSDIPRGRGRGGMAGMGGMGGMPGAGGYGDPSMGMGGMPGAGGYGDPSMGYGDPSMGMGGMGYGDPSMGMGGMGYGDPSMGMGGMGYGDPSMGMGGMPGGGGYGDPSMGYGDPSMSGMGGMGGMGSQRRVTEWKLVRFFDFDAEPGKVYKYRVQLLVEDPNYPQEPSFEVNVRMLEDSAAARIAQLKERESEGGSRQFFHRTAWSEPSEPVSVESFQRFYAGDVDSRALVSTHKNGAEVANRGLTAKMVGVVWDPSWAADVSHDKQVTQGSVLDYQGTVEVVHPLTLEFKKLEKYDFRGKAVVADLRGGLVVGGESLEPVLSPAEFAVVDAEGNLVVRHEFDDIQRYRRYAFVEDEPASTAGAGGGYDMMMPGGTPGGMPGGDMMPGGGDGGRRRGRGR